ncbi:glycosyltransferase [Cyanobium sp. Aljojuca 7D2]|uniref:glycosyltransferase n=1 Tax=Cyanobium sp. Aljojuca 7D2 TaxID=2823698 RepID=UPI0020CC8EB1|nr:glycosyltransferase [Cyanobium sp. Aljojuca 7D2]MCP9890239.1 glycosyltransferase [Cyanobium sp. Aljojuca 7D2]
MNATTGNTPKPPLLLLVGMHRSGTSLLGNLLHAAGVALPGPLIAGDQHNPEGYFERADITDLQEQLLIDLDRWWPGAKGMLPLPNDWLQRPETQTTAAQLRRLLAAESQQQSGPWSIKDPRSSLLLPLWQQACQALAIPLRLVLAVRDPAEVVSSLCARDAEAAGMTAERAELLWWHHNQTVLVGAAGLPLQVVSYSRWFSPGSGPSDQLRQLLQFCDLKVAAADPAVLERCLSQIKPQHRRSDTHAPAQCLAPRTLKLHQALSRGDLRRAKRLASKPPKAIQPVLTQTIHGLKARIRALLWHLRAQQASSSSWDPGAWFDEDFYRGQWPGLAACSRAALLHHYKQAGWRASTPPHPLFDPNYFRQACEQAASALSGDPPTHVHPWGPAAEALTLSAHQSQPEAAIALLGSWVSRGQISSNDLRAIAALPTGALASDHPQAVQEGASPWSAAILGGSWHHWQSHALLQHLPLVLTSEPIQWFEGLPTPATASQHQSATVVLHLQPVEQTNLEGLLLNLTQAYVVDPDTKRVLLLRRLGVNAHLISTADPIQRPLDENAATRASTSLGLPAPKALATQPAVLCLGSAGPLWERLLDETCWCLPSFHALQTPSVGQARALAAWLQSCQLEGIQLVELGPPNNTPAFDGFAALASPNPKPPGWLPVQRFHFEITPAELQAELTWRRQGCPPASACITPDPEHVCLWQHQHGTPAASVCVSLHNYASRITAALESARRQTLRALELIVVDDASEDEGAAVVVAWLKQHGQRFARVQLLQHAHNGGLAAARNTAFRAAMAPWCFVLDADNQLLPNAVERCLAIAEAAPTSTAVVHPLIHLASDPLATANKPQSSQESVSLPEALLSTYSWQQQCFRAGNYVDAMALIRRAAWQEVGGYTHIPGGWEDYDFWCKLMDAGMHGVLCPQPLAVYTVHDASMTANATARSQRPLSRLLQQRHPWLELPGAMEAEAARAQSKDPDEHMKNPDR